MRYPKVLLVNPFYSNYRFPIPVIPPGLGYLAEYLARNGVECSVLDMGLGYGSRDLIARIGDYRPALVGVSMMTHHYKRIYSMIGDVKAAFPAIPIVAGGPHVSSLLGTVLTECPALDYGVTLEGEQTLLDLCQGVPGGEILGLIFRRDGEIVYTGPRPFAKDLDTLPYPRYGGFELEKYGIGMSIVTSRGCPYACIYCSCNIIGKAYRARSAESVVEEIGYWRGKGYREFGFQEDNPSFDKDRMRAICDLLLSRGLRDLSLMCGNGVRADRVDRPLLAKMREAGFKRLAFGVEAGNDRVLKSLRKGTSIAVMESAVKDACDLGFFVSLFFLVGSPGETPSDVEDSIRFALGHEISDVSFYNLVPMPNTELFSWVERNGRFLIRPEEYLNATPFPSLSNDPVFETHDFPRAERMRMLRRTKEVSRVVRRRVIERRLASVTRLSRLIAYVYTRESVQRLDRFLNSYLWTRRLIGRIRGAARDIIYG